MGESEAVLLWGGHCDFFLSDHCLECSFCSPLQSPRLQIIDNSYVVI